MVIFPESEYNLNFYKDPNVYVDIVFFRLKMEVLTAL